MIKSLLIASAVAVAVAAAAQSARASDAPTAAPAAVPAGGSRDGGFTPPPLSKADQEKVLYSLGATVGKSLSVFSLSKAEAETVKKGFGDAVSNAKLKYDPDTYRQQVVTLAQDRSKARAVTEKEKGKDFVAKAEKEKGAKKLPSGMVYLELAAGKGANPTAGDTVKVDYKGTLLDGTEFDSSYKHGQAVTIPLAKVIPCWGEGVQQMKVGGKAKLVCPSTVAYGDNGAPPNVPPGATLVFEIELHEIVPAPPPNSTFTPPAGSFKP